jgi:uncharacterized metal-binding protein
MVQAQCAKCEAKLCRTEKFEKTALPMFCPMRNSGDLIERALSRYDRSDLKRLYLASTIGEKEAYERVRGGIMAVRPRIREMAEFAKRMNFKNIGVAFCAGLSDEGRRAVEILEAHGLTVHSVCCKCGAVDKTKLGVQKEYKIADPEKHEPGCNPLTQAEILNGANTGFNIIIGLCVGHDMLFTIGSKAPVTTLIAKDRVTGHNPLASLYVRYHKGLI